VEWAGALGLSARGLFGDWQLGNEFSRKFGWNDRATQLLQNLKAKSGLANRDDIVTMMDYFDADEGRERGSS